MKKNNGLVIGKFYPPHEGHHHLIEVAENNCDHLYVIILWSEQESIPAERRKAWLEEYHPNATIIAAQDEYDVDYDDPKAWKNHVKVMKQALHPYPDPKGAEWLSPDNIMKSGFQHKIHTVFSSEEYGPELARRFKAQHFPVDVDRCLFPVSGTAVREDVAGNWQYLRPAVRAYLTKRICVTGAESTGTTTLARSLAQVLDTVWVPEFGRFFTEGMGGNHDWASRDFTYIAKKQLELEEEFARKAGPIMVCDTDQMATAVWHERYMGARSVEVEAMAAKHHYPLYFITHHKGVKWEDDGTRDGEGEVREAMTNDFITRLDGDEVLERSSVVLLKGDEDVRLRAALKHAQHLLQQGWQFNPPKG